MIIGRKEEIADLEWHYSLHQTEFVAIYGRLGLGKTFLVEETFGERIVFRHTALPPDVARATGNQLKAQLEHFHESLLTHGLTGCSCPDNWLSAFRLLERLLEDKRGNGRRLIFIDELPWMDSPKSGFLSGLEAFWNGWACRWPDIMLIVCGSDASWMRTMLEDNHGGFYGRLTRTIALKPFSLAESRQFLLSRNPALSDHDIARLHMVFGGIPGLLEKQLDAGDMAKEIDMLFSSMHGNRNGLGNIARLLSKRASGFTKREIAAATGLGEGGNLTKLLTTLEANGIIARYVPFGMSKRAQHYMLTDPFCLFFFSLVEGKAPIPNPMEEAEDKDWKRKAFTLMCCSHVPQIKKALGIGGVRTREHLASKDEGRVLELLIERADKIVNVCEMEASSSALNVGKAEYLAMMKRAGILYQSLPKKVVIRFTLVASHGLGNSEYSSVFNDVITLDDLFA